MLLVLLFLVSVGAAIPLEESTAQEMVDNLKEILPRNPDVLTIFTNNLKIALMMLIPFFGLVIGAYAIFNTGLFFSASSIITSTPGILILFVTILLPYFWIEFAAYAAAMTQNVFVSLSLLHRSVRNELIHVTITIGMLTSLLFLGAIVEVAILNLLQ